MPFCCGWQGVPGNPLFVIKERLFGRLLRVVFVSSLFLLIFPALTWPAFAARFRDSLDREVDVQVPPQRIVPLAPSITEILYYLGLEDRVVGVTQYSYFPPEAAKKPKVGSYIDLNVEKIMSLSPDLVIGTVDGNQPWVVRLLEEAGVPVFLVNPRHVSKVIKTIATIGRVCGVALEGDRSANRLKARMDRVLAKVTGRNRPLVFLQINIKPIMTVNRNTFHHDLIHLAGGVNMTAQEPITYPRLSLEEVIRRKPEVILVSSMERGGRFEKARQDWMAWTSIPAVKNGRVHLIDSDLIDRPSPRIIQGLENMARLLHPEVRWDG
jgi:iron complex transport system substrate-binding protein